MSIATGLKRSRSDLLSAIQFLTRMPLPSIDYRQDSLSGSVKFFPFVGALIGGAAALLSRVSVQHLPRLASAFMVLIFLVLITGALHEDGLADAADGFGGGHIREKILLIMRDSRIGSYGATALCLSLVGRLILISSLPLDHIARYLIVANVLCRWTILPLSYFLPPARDGEGQGARIARLTTRFSLIIGTIFAVAFSSILLRWQAFVPLAIAILITFVSGRFYSRRIGGITGDCFGATTQITEMVIYMCGVWVA
jgi:adenosylcobinamide-GDP ribazoletransferase